MVKTVFKRKYMIKYLNVLINNEIVCKKAVCTTNYWAGMWGVFTFLRKVLKLLSNGAYYDIIMLNKLAKRLTV